LTDVVVVSRRSVGSGDRPAKAGEFSGDGDRDERAALAALGVEPLPGVASRSPGE
jgi:hypothetical protein